MNKKSVRDLVGLMLLFGLSGLIISCGIIEPPSPPLPTATIVPPTIPHSIEGRSDCRACHAQGIGGAPQFPVATHSERPSDVCLACHDISSDDKESQVLKIPFQDRNAFPYFDSSGGNPPDTEEPATPAQTEEPTAPPAGETKQPPAAAAKGIYDSMCAACHGPDQEGISGFAPALTPGSLENSSDEEVKSAIFDGIEGTAMPAFGETLSQEEIDTLLQLIKYSSP